VSGNYAAVAIMAALRHRARTGEGQFVDMSLNSAA
jgi:crotonobetainyl-CoA:carnitine CoA-transferase CaiB-like acyl-CoA transferase